uniref:Uncharacterized protein PB18E9.04c-like n=1 Tax=Crassostrea virginica TaxID=6565 RepID=A0A8B8BA10_CRAVI|nr:uncharacterized protein PB18E9.04c-like [Crassostrea virginica]
MRQRRQTPGEDYTYTLEILIVVDPAVFSWFTSQSRPGTERDMTEEATNKTLRHYRRVFRGIKTRFVTSTVLSLNLVLVDIIIPENLSFPSPIPFMPSPRSLITAPEVLDTFRNWVNKTELPNHDHALLFTGYNLTYGGSPSSTGLSYPDSVCTELAMSVVEESYDERTPLYAAQELGRSLGSRLDMDGNFCRATNLNIMTTKFVFNSPKVPNLWKFSRCSLAYIQDFLQKLDSDGSDCLRKHTTISSPVNVPPTPEVDAQCRTAFGLDSFLCRAVTGTDYSALCGGMECYLPATGACASVLPLDGTVCGNFSICNEGTCVFSNEGQNVPDECPFGDQPVLPGSVGCGDRVYGRPYDCYLPSLNAACCASCGEIKTDITGCEYGDRTDRCQYSKCPSYNNFTRENLCCLTCINGTSLIKTTTAVVPTPSTSPLLPTTESTPEPISTSASILSTARRTEATASTASTVSGKPSESTPSGSSQETAIPVTSFEPTSRVPVTSSAATSPSPTTEFLSSTKRTSSQRTAETTTTIAKTTDLSYTTNTATSTTTATTEKTTYMSSAISDSTYSESASLWTTSDVISTQVTTSSSSDEDSSCGGGSSEQSSEKEKTKEWKKKQKKLEKERKKYEKRMKDLKKKYDKMMKKLRKLLGIDFSTLL